jgi:hypothetical protein
MGIFKKDDDPEKESKRIGRQEVANVAAGWVTQAQNSEPFS